MTALRPCRSFRVVSRAPEADAHSSVPDFHPQCAIGRDVRRHQPKLPTGFQQTSPAIVTPPSTEVQTGAAKAQTRRQSGGGKLSCGFLPSPTNLVGDDAEIERPQIALLEFGALAFGAPSKPNFIGFIERDKHWRMGSKNDQGRTFCAGKRAMTQGSLTNGASVFTLARPIPIRIGVRCSCNRNQNSETSVLGGL